MRLYNDGSITYDPDDLDEGKVKATYSGIREKPLNRLVYFEYQIELPSRVLRWFNERDNVWGRNFQASKTDKHLKLSKLTATDKEKLKEHITIVDGHETRFNEVSTLNQLLKRLVSLLPSLS